MSKSAEAAEENLYNCPVEATISQIGDWAAPIWQERFY